MIQTIYIQNVKCSGCAHTIQTKLESIKSISNIEINVENGQVTFECDSKEALLTVKKTLKSIGYPEKNEENTLGSKAKSYVSCAIGKMNS